MDNNLVSWFEIPVSDMDRAKDFYEKVFEINIQVQDFGGVLMGWFPFSENKPGATGSLVKHAASYIPSDTHGVLIYFSSDDVAIPLNRVKEYGGKIIQEKTQISEDIGYMGLFIDSEGNRIALHSRN